VVVAAVGPGRKMTRQGLHVSERGQLVGWADRAGSWIRANSRRKKILFKVLLDFGFDKTLENCTGRF
jgi:hypothetical protein